LAADGVKPGDALRNTAYVTVQFDGAVTAFHIKPIWVEDVAVAVSAPGALGPVVQFWVGGAPAALIVSVAALLVTVPLASLTTTVKLDALFDVVVAGVV
jgi:hypothetical protein